MQPFYDWWRTLPEWPKPVIVTAAIGLVAWLLNLAIKMVRRKSSRKKVENNANQTQSLTVNFGGTSEVSKPENEQKETAPRISYVQFHSTRLSENGGYVWQQAPANASGFCGFPALLAEFKNKPREVGKQTASASAVHANLVFKGRGDTPEKHVNCGTWLSQYTNFVTFNSGASHQLIVAVLADNSPITLENRRTAHPLAGGRFHRGIRIVEVDRVALTAPDGEVEITLIDKWEYTVFNGVFDFAASADDMRLALRG